MAFDAHKNFAYSTVATAPSPATSGTSLVVGSGEGALFPTVPFNATIWPVSSNPLSSNAEIVRVTAISTDTLTITRAQESSSARSVIIGDQIAATITAKTLNDAEDQSRAYVKDEPLVLSDPYVYDLEDGVVWTDATQQSVTIAAMDYEPIADWLVWPGSTTHFNEDPLILDSPILFNLPGDTQTLLWLDAARCPQTISTLLIIGV